MKYLLILLLLFPFSASAQLNTHQGGTGLVDISSGSIPFGSIYNIRMATSSALQFNSTAARLSTTYASTTALSATALCLTGDLPCKTAWPTSSSGTVSTSTNETANFASYWTSTSGTPALLGATSTLYFAPTGRIGIGTTTPGALFSVHGNGLFSGNITAANITATGTMAFGTTTLTNLIVTNLSTSTFAGGLTVGTSQFVVQQSSGNVGIGTTSPATTLSVTGSGYLTGGLGVGVVNTTANTIDVSQFGSYKQAGNTILYASTTNFSTLVGIGAGSGLLAAATGNTAIGYQALNLATSTTDNTAIGYQALQDPFDPGGGYGIQNVAIGSSALKGSTTGYENTAIGYQSMMANTTGAQNAAIGSRTLKANTTGTNNVVIGKDAMFTNTTGGQNVALGSYALFANTTGNANIAIGYETMRTNTTGSQNLGVGVQALKENTSGAQNAAVGGQGALTHNTTGNNNNAFGTNALAGNTTASYNNAFGVAALASNAGGGENDAMGDGALINNTTGGHNNALGSSALGGNTTGSRNTGIGTQTLYGNSTGDNNIAIGYLAGRYETGSNAFYINNVNQTNTANEKAYSLLYGTFSGSGGSLTGQQLVINGNVGISTTTPAQKLTIAGDLGFYGTIPTLSSCGTSPAIVKGSTDSAFELTQGSISTGCVITFAVAKTNAPFCTLSGEAGLAFSYVVAADKITVTNIGALSSTKITGICVQNNN